MNNKVENSKKSKKKKIKVNKSTLMIIIIINIVLVIAFAFAIFKWQDVNNKNTTIEKVDKGLYTDMTSKEMYDATRGLQISEKQGLAEMFIKKWKQDKKNNINSVADNETQARYLFCL